MEPELLNRGLDSSPARARRGFLPRALGALLVALATFCATLLYLARAERDGPREVVAAHLEALNVGDIAGAYLYFSDSYRAGISFEVFRHLVAMHRPLFHTRQVRFGHPAISQNRADLELRVTMATGADYPVEYHLVRERGLWRIADFRFHLGQGHTERDDGRI